ncbi:hypothetical protein ACS0TY_023732 [Phlomoides rotata]
MIREERMEDSMFLVHVPGQIIIFRLPDETCEVLVDYRSDYFYQEGRLQFEFKDAHPFTESFAYTETEHYYYYVFNPTTKQVRNIHKGNSAVMLSLVFDPSVSEYYKVVAIWKNPSTNVISVSQYGSDTREWKTRDADAAFPDAGLTLAKILSCNCRAYFTRNKHPSFYSSPVKLGNTRYVVELNGHLHCINLSFNQDKPCFDITELIDNKWSESDSYQLKRVLDKQKAEILGMIREERMEDSMFLVHVPGQIIIFRLRDETCEVLVDYRSDYFYQEGRLQFEFKDVHPFTESFASV